MKPTNKYYGYSPPEQEEYDVECPNCEFEFNRYLSNDRLCPCCGAPIFPDPDDMP